MTYKVKLPLVDRKYY